MRIHFIGCKGASMQRLMGITEDLGFSVSGSDISLNGHSEENVKEADLVVYTNAVDKSNVELLYAKKNNIQAIERARFLALISNRFLNTIAIAGSHGKTTTTAMVASVFSSLDATVHIGCDCAQKNGAWHKKELGEKNIFSSSILGQYFITEACEYRHSFLQLSPRLAVLLNAEHDHTDCYPTYSEYLATIWAFLGKSKAVLINGDDNLLYKGAKNFGYTTMGFNPRCDYTVKNITTSKTGKRFSVYYKNRFVTKLSINLFGDYNVFNALASFAVGHHFSLEKSKIKHGLQQFKGVNRRMEFLGRVKEKEVYSDYAHHPVELHAMLKAAKERTSKKVAVVFEPHTYTRTQSLYKEFAQGLSLADHIFLMPVYPAREKEIKNGKTEVILQALLNQGKEATYFEKYAYLFSNLTKLEKNTIIIFAGAGTIDKYARRFAADKNTPPSSGSHR